MQTAKLFQIGYSQAVRLPRGFRFECQAEICIERDGDRIILSPIRKASIERLIASLEGFDVFPGREPAGQADPRQSLQADGS